MTSEKIGPAQKRRNGTRPVSHCQYIDPSMNYTSSLDPAGRRYDALDRLIIGLDRALAGVQRRPRQGTPRPYSCEGIPEAALDPRERRRSEGFMRVNHAGEVAAQALYEAQGLTARSEEVRRAMEQAAAEEQDHLDWCR